MHSSTSNVGTKYQATLYHKCSLWQHYHHLNMASHVTLVPNQRKLCYACTECLCVIDIVMHWLAYIYVCLL